MINERQFALNFTGFWRSSLPNLEAVLRVLNLGPEREHKPYVPSSNPQRRDLISEVGFRLAAQTSQTGRVSGSDVTLAYEKAVAFLVDEADLGGKANFPPLSELERDESVHLCERIREFLRYRRHRPIEFFPSFAGVGMLARCHGDILVGETIVEVKYVDRSFRSTDLKQAITYAMLARIAGTKIDGMIVFNPLRGTYVEMSLFELVFGASGQSVEEFEFEFIQALSSSGVSR